LHFLGSAYRYKQHGQSLWSWDDGKGEITQKTETVKSYSNNLENPLDGKTMLESVTEAMDFTKKAKNSNSLSKIIFLSAVMFLLLILTTRDLHSEKA
jgi:hypothetical protein